MSSLHSSVVGPVIVAKAVLTDLFEMNGICDQLKYSLLKLILPLPLLREPFFPLRMTTKGGISSA